jgi:thrombospondin type 3 repeat protein
MRATRHHWPIRRSGLGWLGAGRVIAGLALGFTLVAVGFAGLRTTIIGDSSPDGLGDRPARPQIIPDLLAAKPGGVFTGGAKPRVLPVAGVTATAIAPASPSGGATPLPGETHPVGVGRSPSGQARTRPLDISVGPTQDVAAPPSHGSLRDTDGDGVPDVVERRLGTDPNSRDTDGDGMPDGWEVRFGLNPRLDLDANADPDHDGLSNLNEYRLGTNPHLLDTDNNGVPDGGGDFDGDGLPNAVEQKLGLDPTDGLTPPKERVQTRTALNATTPAPTRDVLAAAAFAAASPTVASTPTNDGTLDSDGDGLPNALEVLMGLDPGNPATNGIPDGKRDYDLDGLPNALEVALGLNPMKADSNGDGVPDGKEDSDGDGLPNAVELRLHLNPAAADTDHNGVLDGDEDTDGDGMTNAAEIAAGRDPAVPDAPAPAPAPAPAVAPVVPTTPADPAPAAPAVPAIAAPADPAPPTP